MTPKRKATRQQAAAEAQMFGQIVAFCAIVFLVAFMMLALGG